MENIISKVGDWGNAPKCKKKKSREWLLLFAQVGTNLQILL